MVTNLKEFLYTKGSDPKLDVQLDAARKFGKVRLGSDAVFWRAAFRQYAVSLDRVQRIRRGMNTVIGRLCAGGRNYDVEYLVLTLTDGSELVIHIADDNKQIALDLVAALEQEHPEIKFGKE